MKNLILLFLLFTIPFSGNCKNKRKIKRLNKKEIVLKSKNYNKESKKYFATYYGNTYKGKRKTANGEHFNMYELTCASNKFPFNTKLKITNIKNNKSVIVRVNDRGGMHKNIIDLTYGAFGKIAKHSCGKIQINVEIVD